MLFSIFILSHFRDTYINLIPYAQSSKKRKTKFSESANGAVLSDMACSLSLKRVTSSSFFNNLLRSVSAAPSVARSFSTNASEVTTFDNDDRSVDVDRRSDRSLSRRGDSVPAFFSGSSRYLFPFLFIILLV